jgi:hypothetical protein
MLYSYLQRKIVYAEISTRFVVHDELISTKFGKDSLFMLNSYLQIFVVRAELISTNICFSYFTQNYKDYLTETRNIFS